jgi:hypothetical protein
MCKTTGLILNIPGLQIFYFFEFLPHLFSFSLVTSNNIFTTSTHLLFFCLRLCSLTLVSSPWNLDDLNYYESFSMWDETVYVSLFRLKETEECNVFRISCRPSIVIVRGSHNRQTTLPVQTSQPLHHRSNKEPYTNKHIIGATTKTH